jgi:hypothetical protein
LAKRGTHDHPKTKGLARILQIPRAQAYGMLCLLWEFAADRCPQGDIGKYTDEEIAEELLWPEDRDCKSLIDALVEKKWVDRDIPVANGCSGRLVIHDWAEHCEDSVHMALARAGKYFANGVMPKLSRLSDKEKSRISGLYKGATVEPTVRTDSSFVRTKPESVRTTKPSQAMPSLTKPRQTNSPKEARRNYKPRKAPQPQMATASGDGPEDSQANFSENRIGFRRSGLSSGEACGGSPIGEIDHAALRKFKADFRHKNRHFPALSEFPPDLRVMEENRIRGEALALEEIEFRGSFSTANGRPPTLAEYPAHLQVLHAQTGGSK